MAKQEREYFVGRRDNSIWYELNGSYYARAIPGSIKQPEATKMRSTNFAIATRVGRTMRCLLLQVIPFSKDKKMQNRFGKAIMKWLQLNMPEQLLPATSQPFIQNFQFNNECTLKERWKIALPVTRPGDDMLQLHIPAFTPEQGIAAPAHTTLVTCTITAAACTLENGADASNFIKSLSIPYTSIEIPAQIIDLPITTPPGSLLVVAVMLKYTLSKKGRLKPTTNIAFMPSAIIAAMYV